MVIIGEKLRAVLHLFLIWTFLGSVEVFADFRELKRVFLKKDETKKLLVKYDTYERLFEFRWTLFVNEGLVVFRSYDKIVAQNVLYLSERSGSFRVELKSRGADNLNLPYLLVMFKDFDYEKNEAYFEILLSDKQRQIELEEL